MPTLDDFFGATNAVSHPRLRDWKNRLEAPNTNATLEVYRSRGDFGPGQPKMYVQFYDSGRPIHLDEVAWDDDLNAGLIQLKVKSVSHEKEAERFSLGLRAAMRKAERKFGDSYFNAVLIELIKDSDLTRHREIAEVMKYAYANAPYREGGAFSRYMVCRDLIADAISGRAKELTQQLGYSEDDAKRILVLAIARYLDERFSVSSRRELGML
jgi:hypothetical protein